MRVLRTKIASQNYCENEINWHVWTYLGQSRFSPNVKWFSLMKGRRRPISFSLLTTEVKEGSWPPVRSPAPQPESTSLAAWWWTLGHSSLDFFSPSGQGVWWGVFFKTFFWMWTIFKVFIECITIWLLLFCSVFLARVVWDLSSPARDWTCTPCIGSKVLITGPWGRSLVSL